jgi:peptide/nickel transport system permease protein
MTSPASALAVDVGRRPGSFGRAVKLLVSRKRTTFVVVLLGMMLFVGVFADELASDLPVLCSVHGHVYVAPNVTHPHALDGWNQARIRDEGDWAFGPLVHYGPEETTGDALLPPLRVAQHPLGTDGNGRDVFARLVHGTRTTLGVALLAVAAFASLGLFLGAMTGFFGRRLDFVVSRVVETLSSFPVPIVVLVVQTLVVRPGLFSFLATIVLLRWTEVARLVRAEVLSVSSADWVLAARALGASPARVLRRHVLPMAVTPAIVAGVLGVGQVVLLESALDFLRVGLPSSIPSWGEMLSESRDHFEAWWLLLFPGTLVFTVAVATNAIGEALRDGLDPYQVHEGDADLVEA